MADDRGFRVNRVQPSGFQGLLRDMLKALGIDRTRNTDRAATPRRAADRSHDDEQARRFNEATRRRTPLRSEFGEGRDTVERDRRGPASEASLAAEWALYRAQADEIEQRAIRISSSVAQTSEVATADALGEDIAYALADFCLDPAVGSCGQWEVALPLREDLLPDTTLALSVSPDRIVIRFQTTNATAGSLLSACLQPLTQSLARQLGDGVELIIQT